MKKYELTEETIKVKGKTLYRIKALTNFNDVKAGDLGGYVESEDNLSQDGTCWVYGDAEVYDNAKIFDNAEVTGYAEVYGNARVFNNAQVYDNAKVYEFTQVYDNALVYGNARVYENAWIYGNAKIYDYAKVHGNAEIYSAKINKGDFKSGRITKDLTTTNESTSLRSLLSKLNG